MDPNEYLLKFFAELERLVDGHDTRHAISTTRTGQLEIRSWLRRLVLGDTGRTQRRSGHGGKRRRQRSKILPDQHLTEPRRPYLRKGE